MITFVLTAKTINWKEQNEYIEKIRDEVKEVIRLYKHTDYEIYNRRFKSKVEDEIIIKLISV